MKKKSIFKKRKFYILSSVFLMIGLLATFIISDYLSPSEELTFNSETGYYEVEQKPITDIVDAEGEATFSITNLYSYTGTFSMSTFAPLNSVSVPQGTEIGIGSMEELVAFSWLCNPDINPYVNATDVGYRRYLGFSYKLTNNITANSSLRFIPVGTESDYPFSGTFNGNGYDITGLTMLFITNIGESSESFETNYPKTKNAMEYYAMFSRNSGTICNVGLINTSMNTNYTTDDTFYKAAALCGENKSTGNINHCFVRDLRETSKTCGIITIGGFTISGMVFNNKGSFSNSYSAYNYVVNGGVEDYNDYNEILYENENPNNTKNLYFYNGSIVTIDGEKQNSFVTYSSLTTVGVSYSTGLAANRTYKATYCPSTDVLNDKINTDDNLWYVMDDYGTVNGGYLKKLMPTPILRGITITSENVIRIQSVRDYAFLYEMLNANAKFAESNFTYQIESNINLASLDYTRYKYNGAIEANIVGKQGTYNSIKIGTGSTYSEYPTIYNPDLENTYVTVEGFNAYGVFPYFYGTMENLNVVLSPKDNSVKEYNLTVTGNNNIAAFGAVTGFMDSGTIKNVNVFGNVKLTGTAKVFAGGVVGVITGLGKVEDVTTKGSINLSLTATKTDPNYYMQGSAVGGVVGYMDNVTGSVRTALNLMNIETNGLANTDFAIGGILGAGYTNNAYNLQNEGTITVGTTTTNASYKNLFVAGIIGRHLGMLNKVTGINNYGSITVYSNSANTVYAAGVINATPVTSSASSAYELNKTSNYLSNNNYKINGKDTYVATRIINAADVTVNKNSNANNFYSDVINLITYECNAHLIGIYNLAYTQLANNNGTKDAIGAQTITMEGAYKFAGIVSNKCYSKDIIKLETVYNLRDINFELSSALAESSAVALNYAGVALGENMNFTDVRNEGNISYTFKDGSSVATTSTMKISGVFEKLSNGFLATSIYNGGDITVTDSASSDINVKIYASGICYENASVISDASQNPLNASFDNTLVGSLNNVINNGKILVTSSDYNKDTMTITKTENNLPVKNEQTSSTNLCGDVYAAGISYTNSGIISNAFNLGDITIDVFSRYKSYYYVGGIACYLTEASDSSSYAQIRDSANNGRLQVVNMCNSKESYVMVGGIFAQNTNADENIRSVVAFTINYGTLVAFNGYDKTKNASIDKLHSLVGGISAKGLCNIVNVLNYGNIYGSEAVGSMIGAFDLSNYKNEAVNLANTINYGNVWLIPNYKYSIGVPVHATYNTIVDLQSFLHNGTYSESSNEFYYLGSMFGFINYASRSNINVRYVINFFNGAMIVQEANERNVPTVAIDTTTFMTVNGYLDKFGGGSVKYTPLNSVNENGNVGVFSEAFIFRRAINGDSEAIDPSKVTDSYIADFFQFVRFDKVNEILLEKIGWKNIAYLNAAEQLARDVKTMAVFVDGSHADLAKTTVQPSFTSDTWYSNIDDTLLTNFLTETLSNDDGNITDFSSSDLKIILEYILFDSTCISDVSTSIRSDIVDTIIKYYDEINTNYSTLLQTLLYDELLAKVVSGEDTNYIAVQSKIVSVLEAASTTELEKVMDNYLSLLLEDTNNVILTPLFETLDSEGEDYYLTSKMNLINSLLTGYSNETLTTMADELLEGASTSTDKLKYSKYLTEHPSDALDIYSHLIAANAFATNSTYLATINTSLSKYYSNDLLEDSNFDVDNIVDDYDSVTSAYSWINGSKWTYDKDYTELWNIIKTNTNFQNYIRNNLFNNYVDPTSGISNPSILAKATEFTNTYQSNDGPSKMTEVDLTTGDYATYKAYAGEEIPDIYKRDGTIGNRAVGDYNVKNGGIFRNSNDNNRINNANDNPNPDQPGVLGQNQVIKNRFIYTPDSVNSYATYYYGPYMANGKVFDEKWKKRYNRDREIYEPTAISETTKDYIPVFISTNKKITDDAIANSNTISTKTNSYVFYWNNFGKSGNNPQSSKYQWVSDYILNNSASDGNNYLFYNFKDELDPEDYIVDGYDFTPNRNTTKAIEGSETNKTFASYTARIYYSNSNPNLYKDYSFSNFTITLNTTANQTFEDLNGGNNQRHPLRDLYLKGYVTSSLITGIWFVHSCWKGGNTVNGCYLTSKEDTGNCPSQSNYNSYAGVHTTQYTRYLMDDLLKLDGVQTKGKRDGRVDNDEVGIISALMKNILSTDEGKRIVVSALGEYSKEHDFTSSQAASANYLASALIGTSFARDAVVNVISQQSPTDLENEYYIFTPYASRETLKHKLDALISGYTFASKDLIAMAGAADKGVFKKVLLATLANNRYDNDSGTNTITNKDVTYFIYKYASYLKSQDSSITDAQIATYLSSANATDLTAFTNLSNFTYTDFITSVGGDADADQSLIGYGNPFNVAGLYERMQNKLGNTNEIAADQYLPFVGYDDDNTSQTDVVKVNNVAVGQSANHNGNIGYFTGNDIKAYEKNLSGIQSNKFFSTYENGTVMASNFIYRYADSDIPEVVWDNTFNLNATTMTLLRLQNKVDVDNHLVTINDAWVGGVHYDTIKIPRRVVWVKPQAVGIMRFVMVSTSADYINFTCRKFKRTVLGDLTSNMTGLTDVIDATAGTLRYGRPYLHGDGVTNVETRYPSDRGYAYYYEVEIKAEDIAQGYEFVLDNDRAEKGAYFWYLDLGQNGGDSVQIKYPDLTPIETRYNTYYSTLTEYGDYLASNMIKTYPTTTTSITVTEPTILFVKATDVTEDGKITIDGASTYDVEGVTTTINTVSKNTDGTYRAFYLSGGTYTITATDATITDILTAEIDNSITYTTNGAQITYTDGASSKVIFKGTNYANLSSFKLGIDLSTEIKDTLALVYPSMITGSGANKEYYFFNDATKGDSAVINLFTTQNKKDIIKLLAKADFKDKTSVLGKLITNLQASYYDDLLLSIKDKKVRKNIVKKIIEIANTSSSTYAATEDLIIAAYLGQDYLNYSSTNQLTQTKLKDLLTTYHSGDYQFIASDSSIDAVKFNEFLIHLGVKADLEGYGIFALSSSRGIRNGEFIPDNLNIASMNASYEYSSTYGFVLTKEGTGDSTTYPKSADWRKYGTVASGNTDYTDDNDTSYKDSVNYGFLIEMKQLKKAIATTIFELDLSTTVDTSLVSNYIMYSSEDLIDLASETKNIVYYVPSLYLQQFVGGPKTLSIKNLIISTTATPYKVYSLDGNGNLRIVKTASGTYNTTFSTENLIACSTVKRYRDLYADSYVLEKAITIVAEDTAVYEEYDLIFRPIDFSFDSIYQETTVTNYVSVANTEAKVPSNSGVISLSITSPSYTLNNEGSFKVGSKYYEKSGNVYTLTTDTTYDSNKDYYSVFVKATEKTFKADTTYYQKSGNTYTSQTVTVGGTNDGSYYIATTAQKLPQGFDLSPYISIISQSGNAMDNSFTYGDIKDNCIVDDNGSASVTMYISDTLPMGEYYVNINLYGNIKQVELTKEANKDTSLTLYYNDEKIIDPSTTTKTSNILWGQPFTKYELASLEYLDSYVLAPNATKTVTVTPSYSNKSPNNVLQYRVYNYEVTIVVTSEGGQTKTYKHTLQEQDPFSNGTKYASVFKNGELYEANPTIGTDVNDGSDSTTVLHVEKNVMKVYFTRDEGQPDYRVKYNLEKIYYTEDDENATFDTSHYSYNEYSAFDDSTKKYPSYIVKAKEGEVTADTFNDLVKRLCIKSGNNYIPLTSSSTYDSTATYYFYRSEAKVSLPYAGFNITVVDTMDTGNYVFGYTYTNNTYADTYFERVYTLAEVTSATFTTDGSLYTESNGTYTQVTSGTFSSDKEYYTLSYKMTEDTKVLSGKTYYTYSSDTYTAATGLTVGDLFETMNSIKRTLEFPKIEVVKCPSLNALIDSITFIKEYEALSAMSTLVNPNYSIVPNTSAKNKNANEPVYYDLLDGTGQVITVDTTDRHINYGTYATSAKDYYVVGTTSEANLDDYAPSMELQSEYSKVFQFMTPTKAENYTGASDSTYTDYGVLGNHSDNKIYLYVQFEDADGKTKVFLVETNLKDMSYTGIYDANVKYGQLDSGSNLTQLEILDGSLKGNGIYDIEFQYNSRTYTVSKINGKTDLANSSLFMNFAQETYNNRFWYISYVVFSEDFFQKGLGNNPTAINEDDTAATSTDWGTRIKFYNIAIIDISNNVRFVLEVDAPEDFSQEELDSIYVTFAYNKYVSTVLADTKQLSAYANYTTDLYTYNATDEEYVLVTGELNASTVYYFFDNTTGKYQKASWSNNGTTVYDTFVAQYSLQLMPTAYYSFTVDLPQGYEATYKTDKANTMPDDAPASEANSYLPPSSLVTQTIRVTITIEKRDSEDTSTWGISTSTVKTVTVSPNGLLS